MAYGVKYRLEFSDVLENGKKIEILKDNYSGAVLPLIGTADPVSIKWEGDDDFYSPIIGSTCTLNLFVTNDVQYDNFYAFDEEEFKVKIYYKDASNNYQLYWTGFIVTDSYKQALASTPYQISLQAHDGLGLLSTKFMEILDTDDFLKYVTIQTRHLILNLVNEAISKTNLDLNVCFSTNITLSNTTTQPQDFAGGNRGAKYDGDLQIIDCKTFIENTLKTLNCRIFQSFGKFFIVSNSEYIDNNFFDDQADGTISSNIRNAETKKLQQDKSESPEFKEYDSTGIFVQTFTENILIETKTDLTPLNNDLVVEYIPPAIIVEDKIDLSADNLFENNLNADPTFELPTNKWTIFSSRATIGNHSILLSGKKSIRTNQSTTSQSTYTQMFEGYSNVTTLTIPGGGSILEGIDFSANEEVEYKTNYFLDGSLSSNDPPFSINYTIQRTYNLNSPTIEFWNANSNSWSGISQKNKKTIKSANEWESFKITTKESTTARTNCEVKLIFYLPYRHPGSTLNYLYFDDITISRKINRLDKKIAIQNLSQNSNKIESEYKPFRRFINAFRARDIYSSTTQRIEQLVTQQKINDFRSHVSRYEGTFYNNNKTPVSPKNKIWVNFSEKFVTTSSSGSSTTTLNTNDVNISTDQIGWYITGGNITTPVKITLVNSNSYTLDTAISYSSGDEFALSSFNAIKLPVSNQYPTHEPVSCMIDSMEYNVKANTVSVIMHVPNQDDDVSSTYIQK